MNSSATLKTTGRQQPQGWLDQASAWSIVLCMVGGAVSTVGLVLALQTAFSGEPFPSHWHRNILKLVWATLLPIPSTAWATFQAQRSVWVARVAPRAAAKAVAKAFWLTLLTSVAATFIPVSLMVMLAPPPGGSAAAVLLVAGLCGGTLGLGVIAAAAWRGELAAAWILPGLLALVLVPSTLTSEVQWNAWQAAEGWRGAALAALGASPALAWWLLGPSVTGHRTGSRAVDARTSSLRSQVSRLLRRFTERFRYVDGSTGAMFVGLWVQMPQQIVNRNPEGLLFSPLDSGVTLSAFYRIVLTTAMALSMLSAPTLHWRNLLAPGGSVRRQLGVNTFWMTYVVCLALLASMSAVMLAVAWLFSSESLDVWNQAPGALQRYLPVLLVELALGTALATLLRGRAGSSSLAWGFLACVLVAWCCFHLIVYLLHGQNNPVLMQRDFSYQLLISTATAVCTWAAARAWARADLGELLRSARKRPGVDENDWSERFRPRR